MQTHVTRPLRSVKSFEVDFPCKGLTESAHQALADLHYVFPELSLMEIANHAIMQAWARNYDRIEERKHGGVVVNG